MISARFNEKERHSVELERDTMHARPHLSSVSVLIAQRGGAVLSNAVDTVLYLLVFGNYLSDHGSTRKCCHAFSPLVKFEDFMHSFYNSISLMYKWGRVN